MMVIDWMRAPVFDGPDGAVFGEWVGANEVRMVAPRDMLAPTMLYITDGPIYLKPGIVYFLRKGDWFTAEIVTWPWT